jgi:RNA polymerase-binding transcription factor
MINVQHYQKRLEEIERQLNKRTNRDLQNGRENVIEDAHDAGDSSVADVAADAEFSEAELNSMILQQVQDALQRIKDGTYGNCLVDRKPIEKNRLDAVPWAAYCAKHQAMVEAAGNERHWTL